MKFLRSQIVRKKFFFFLYASDETINCVYVDNHLNEVVNASFAHILKSIVSWGNVCVYACVRACVCV